MGHSYQEAVQMQSWRPHRKTEFPCNDTNIAHSPPWYNTLSSLFLWGQRTPSRTRTHQHAVVMRPSLLSGSTCGEEMRNSHTPHLSLGVSSRCPSLCNLEQPSVSVGPSRDLSVPPALTEQHTSSPVRENQAELLLQRRSEFHNFLPVGSRIQ
jgi:hypothetical protein